MCIRGREVRKALIKNALIRKVLLGKCIVDHAVGTTIMGDTRHTNEHTTEAWYKCYVCA